MFEITEINSSHKVMISSFISESWGSPISVSKGKIHNTTELPGFICIDNGKIKGLITYSITDKNCEIVTLNSDVKNLGLGTQLVNKVIEAAKVKGCRRVWLITTNDNTNAIRFYQKRGFEWVGFYKDAMKASRKIKPEIPVKGDDNIPIKHELEFEYRLL